MKKTKKIVSALLAITMILQFMILSGCGETTVQEPELTVPDIVDIDEATAKNILSSSGLIPSIKYDYDDSVEEGNVIKTEPAVGSTVDKNAKITVYISNGQSYIQSSYSRAQWTPIGAKGDDNWEWYHPYIKDGVMYIECYNVTFGCAVNWYDRYNEGRLSGEASINDTFDKTIPVSAKYTKQSWKAYESQSFTLEIPLSDLDVSKPTDIYLRLARSEKVSENIRISFYITW